MLAKQHIEDVLHASRIEFSDKPTARLPHGLLAPDFIKPENQIGISLLIAHSLSLLSVKGLILAVGLTLARLEHTLLAFKHSGFCIYQWRRFVARDAAEQQRLIEELRETAHGGEARLVCHANVESCFRFQVFIQTFEQRAAARQDNAAIMYVCGDFGR
jgi:hypothetical protein